MSPESEAILLFRLALDGICDKSTIVCSSFMRSHHCSICRSKQQSRPRDMPFRNHCTYHSSNGLHTVPAVGIILCTFVIGMRFLAAALVGQSAVFEQSAFSVVSIRTRPPQSYSGSKMGQRGFCNYKSKVVALCLL